MARTIDTFDFDRPVRLVSGAGDISKREGCWMSLGNVLFTGEWVGDATECVDPLIRDLCIAFNDSLPDDAARAKWIGPHLLEPFGTNRGGKVAHRRRGWFVLERVKQLMLQHAKELPREAVDELDRCATIRGVKTADAVRTVVIRWETTSGPSEQVLMQYRSMLTWMITLGHFRGENPLVFVRRLFLGKSITTCWHECLRLILDTIAVVDTRPAEPVFACDTQALVTTSGGG